MQPESSKHGPVSDEVLAKEARGTMQSNRGTRIDEWHDPEPTGDDLPPVDYSAGPQDSDVADFPVLDRRAVALRSEIAAALPRSLFPTDRATLLAQAENDHATDEVRELLAMLPADHAFRNAEEVWDQLGRRPDAKRF